MASSCSAQSNSSTPASQSFRPAARNPRGAYLFDSHSATFKLQSIATNQQETPSRALQFGTGQKTGVAPEAVRQCEGLEGISLPPLWVPACCAGTRSVGYGLEDSDEVVEVAVCDLLAHGRVAVCGCSSLHLVVVGE